MTEADLHRLIDAARGSRFAQALYDCRSWLDANAPPVTRAADAQASMSDGSTDNRCNSAIIEIMSSASRSPRLDGDRKLYCRLFACDLHGTERNNDPCQVP